MPIYKSTNSGLLTPAMVKTGDKLIILEPVYDTFNVDRQTTYWNGKVALPDGNHKLAGFFESACDAIAAKWGGTTENWVGHTVLIEIKTSKKGTPYISMTPTDDPIVDVSKLVKPEDGMVADAEAQTSPEEKSIEYPTEEISPDDIPF